MGQNDTAWEALFDRYQILKVIEREGRFRISASQIKAYREPRLMTKFDHRINLPRIFAENGLSILPVSRGDYVIADFEAYHDFEEAAPERTRVSAPLQYHSLLPQFLVSEAIALNYAAACGILSDFLGEEALIPTVSGRMSAGEFSFSIRTGAGRERVAVSNAQLEIDAAYEGAQSLVLFEAKRELAGDFLIRQLYYPYRLWQGQMLKPVRPVFLVFSNGVFFLYEYAFAEPDFYNSLRLVRQKNYQIRTGVTRRDLADLLHSICPVPEPALPFPQADSLERVINLTEQLADHPLSRGDITSEYAFNIRQANYYADAGRYLGWIEKEPPFYQLTPNGRALMRMGYRERQLAIAGSILRHKVFHRALGESLARGAPPDRQKAVQIMKESGLYHVDSESTYYRRASTLISWISWILDRTG